MANEYRPPSLIGISGIAHIEHPPPDGSLGSDMKLLPAMVERLSTFTLQGRPHLPLRIADMRKLISQVQKAEELVGYLCQAQNTAQHNAVVGTLLAMEGGAIGLALLRLVSLVARNLVGATAQSGQEQSEEWLYVCEVLGKRLFRLVHGLFISRWNPKASSAPPKLLDFARKLVRMQTLQACVQQLAAASKDYEAANAFEWWRLEGILYRTMYLLNGVATFAEMEAEVAARLGRLDSPFLVEFVRALRESHILEHASRAVLNIHLSAEVPKPDAAVEILCASRVINMLVEACHRLAHTHKLLIKWQSLSADLFGALSGSCVLFAVLLPNVAGLCAADGGPSYGLAREDLPLVDHLSSDPRSPAGPRNLWGIGFFAMIDSVDIGASAGTLGRRAALALLLRTTRLALHSGLAFRTAVGQTVNATVLPGAEDHVARSDGGTSAATEPGGSSPAPVLAPENTASIAMFALTVSHRLLWDSPGHWPALTSEQTEWWRLMMVSVELLAYRGCREDLLDELGRLLGRRMLGMGLPDLPPHCPPPVAAALAGGIIPGIERILRRVGQGTLCSLVSISVLQAFLCPRATPRHGLTPLLAYGEGHQAAALVLTLAKSLRRMDSDSLFDFGAASSSSDFLSIVQAASSSDLSVVGITIACLLSLQLIDSNDFGCGQAEVVDSEGQAASPVATQLGHIAAYAASLWLPELSRIFLHMWQHGRLLKELIDDSLRNSTLLKVLETLLIWIPCLGADQSVRDWAVMTCTAQSGHGAASLEPSRAAAVQSSPAWKLRLLEDINAVAVVGAALKIYDEGNGQFAELLPAACSTALEVKLSRPHQSQAATCSVGTAARAGACGAGRGASPDLEWPWSLKSLRKLAANLAKVEPVLAGRVLHMAEMVHAMANDGQEQVVHNVAGVGRIPIQCSSHMKSFLRPPVQVARLVPTCANPRCNQLEGDSELGVRLKSCGRCGTVSYCCRGCQQMHWHAEHKAECVSRQHR